MTNIQRLLRLGFSVVGMVVVWFALIPTPWPTRAWAAVLLIVLPVLADVQARLIGDAEHIPRMPVYASSAVFLWVLALVTLLVASAGGRPAPDLNLRLPPIPELFGWASAVTVAAIAIVFVATAAGIRESRLTRRLIPVSRSEKLAFAGLSLTAGICEEFVFRGFLLCTIQSARGTLFAVLASSAAFGLLHAYQHPGGALRAGLLAVLLCVPTLVTGSILPAVIAHSLIDLIAGLILARRLDAQMA